MELKDLLKKKKKPSTRKQTAKNVAIGAGIGTAVGVTAGVLLAPKSGKETRGDIAKTAKETLEIVKDGLDAVKDTIEGIVKKETETICSEITDQPAEAEKTEESVPAEEKKETVE